MTASFTIFTFPFRHRLPEIGEPDRVSVLKEIVSTHWDPWLSRFTDDQLEGEELAPGVSRILDASYYFRPFVRETMFPALTKIDAEREAGEPPSRATIRRWCQEEQAPQLLRDHAAIHLTRRAVALQPWQSAELSYAGPGGPFSAHFRIDWCDLHLFPRGAGFLSIKVVTRIAPAAGHRGLTAFNYYFRTVQPLHVDWKVAELKDEDGHKIPVAELIDGLLADVHPYTGSYSRSRVAREQAANMNTFCYFGGDKPLELPEVMPAGESFGAPEIVCYELASASLIRPGVVPAGRYLRNLLDEHGLAIWEDWSAVSLRSGAAFVSHTGDSPALSQNLEHDYFYLYLYCLHQKQALLDLQDQMMTTEVKVGRALRDLRRTFQRFTSFRNSYWFSEVTSRPLGMDLYRVFQAGIDTVELFTAVDSEIGKQHQAYQERVAHRTNAILNFVAFVGLPATLVLTFFGVNMAGITLPDGIDLWTNLGVGFGALTLGLVAWAVLSRFR